MSRKDLINRISKETFLSKKVVEEVLESLMGVLIEELVRTGKASFYGLFSMKTKFRKEYKGYTGIVPASDVIYIRFSKGIRDLVKDYGISTGRSEFINSKNWREFLKYSRAKKTGNTEKGLPRL